MILIIGGAYQGKLEYVFNEYSLINDDVFCCHEDLDYINFNKKIIYNINLFILAMLKKNKNSLEYIKNNIEKFNNKIIICEDISCGVVPIDSTMRKLREEVGYILSIISKKSDKVVRVFCGIGMVIK